MSVIMPALTRRPPGLQSCSFSPTNEATNCCGRQSAWHILWHTVVASPVCDRHMAVVLGRWVFEDRHPIGRDCAMPGSEWIVDGGRCEIPGNGESAIGLELAGGEPR